MEDRFKGGVFDIKRLFLKKKRSMVMKVKDGRRGWANTRRLIGEGQSDC